MQVKYNDVIKEAEAIFYFATDTSIAQMLYPYKKNLPIAFFDDYEFGLNRYVVTFNSTDVIGYSSGTTFSLFDDKAHDIELYKRLYNFMIEEGLWTK